MLSYRLKRFLLIGTITNCNVVVYRSPKTAKWPLLWEMDSFCRFADRAAGKPDYDRKPITCDWLLLRLPLASACGWGTAAPWPA